jgi:hypothetical protein
MTVVHCPCCRDEVTVPAKASPRALVRCPLCLEEYRLSEALSELPPALLVIDGTVADEEAALVGAGEAEAEAGGSYEMAGGGVYGSAGVFDSSAPAGATVAPARPLKGKIRKKKPKNAIVEILKVVIGGVVGIGLAVPIIWWAPGGSDIFGIGPAVSDYVPWIVPAKYHRTKGGENGNSTNNQTAGGPSFPPSTGQGLPVNPNLQAAVDKTKNSKNKRPSPPPEPMPEQLIGELDPLGNPVVTAPSVEVPSLDPNPTPAPMPKPMPTPEPPPEPVSVTPEPMLPTPADFQKAVLDAADSLTKVNDSTGQDANERKKLFTNMYQAASEMGRQVSYLSTSDADLYESVQTMQTFLTALASSNKVTAMKSLTDLQLRARKHNEGVFLACTVQDIQAAGSLFECQVSAGKSGTGTAVVSPNNPQDFCKPGDELLIVGRVIDDPKKNLPGYDGASSRVILYGYHAAVPKAGAE